ncbi:unnamed protein product [Lactuca saligna]|uniref:Uncharacterized protein n=1 Tax=Lactuca saligna TaxID=75948 RepID=A0AA36E355_LACSI|nr:unnamed protein product [Lactuca saligna]
MVESTQVTHNVQSLIIDPVQFIQDVQRPNSKLAPVQEDAQIQMVNEETFGSGSSSAPPHPEYDVASVKLAKLLAYQDSISQSKGNGISIGSGQRGDEDFHQTVSKLKQEIVFVKQESTEKDLLIDSLDVRVSNLEQENLAKDAKISELQANLGGLTALFFDLKQHLHQKFGDDFQPLSAEGEKIYASSSNPVNPPFEHSGERVVRHAPDANLDTFLSSGPSSTQERREKQARIEQLKGKMLVMKHLDQNVPGDHPEMFLRETGKKFTDKYRDRSGILMWGYDADKKMWVVKRKSHRIEYYERPTKFISWKKVDLAKVIHAPFNNPTNDSMA